MGGDRVLMTMPGRNHKRSKMVARQINAKPWHGKPIFTPYLGSQSSFVVLEKLPNSVVKSFSDNESSCEYGESLRVGRRGRTGA